LEFSYAFVVDRACCAGPHAGPTPCGGELDLHANDRDLIHNHFLSILIPLLRDDFIQHTAKARIIHKTDNNDRQQQQSSAVADFK